MALYRDKRLAPTLPRLVHANDNSHGRLTSRSGYVYPPYLVLERGMTLSKWVADSEGGRGYGEVLTMLESVAHLLQVRSCADCNGSRAASGAHTLAFVANRIIVAIGGNKGRNTPLLRPICAAYL